MRYVFEGCVLDTEQYVLDKSGLSIALQPKVFQVLLYLLQHRNRVVAKQKLYEQVWPEQFISDATVESVIKAIRFVATVTVMQAEAQRVAEHVSQATTLVQGPIGPEQGETSLDVLPVCRRIACKYISCRSPLARCVATATHGNVLSPDGCGSLSRTARPRVPPRGDARLPYGL